MKYWTESYQQRRIVKDLIRKHNACYAMRDSLAGAGTGDGSEFDREIKKAFYGLHEATLALCRAIGYYQAKIRKE